MQCQAIRKKGVSRDVKVVAELRESVDRDLLSVALFSWLMDRLRAEKEHQPRRSTDMPSLPRERDDGGWTW